MKKILLTLIAFVAIVSCQKDAFDEDMVMPEGITPIKAQIESYTAEDAFNLIMSMNNLKSNAKPVPSTTARSGADGANWLHIILFDHNSNPYASLSSDDSAEACYENLTGFYSSILYTLDSTARTLTVNIINADGTTVNSVNNLSASLVTNFEGANSFGATLDKLIVNTNAARDAAAAGNVPAASTFNLSCAAPVAPLTLATPVINGEVATIEYTLSAAAAGASLVATSSPAGIVASTVAASTTTGTITINRGTAPYDTNIIVTISGVANNPVNVNVNFGPAPAMVWTETSRTGSHSAHSLRVVYTHTNGASYEIFSAPAPLSGYLAKGIDGAGGADVADNVLNFAADSEADVKTAIEGSSANGGFGFPITQ